MHYLADAAIILLIGLALILCSWWIAHPKCTLLENTVIGAGVLLGAAGSLHALGGHLGVLSLGAWPVLLILLLPLRRPIQDTLATFRSSAKNTWRGAIKLRGANLLLALYLAFVTLLTLALSLAPPNANDYDSLVYHLAAPQVYIDAGRVLELPYDHHTYFPFLTEMLFALGLAWKGPVLAKLFHWLMLPLCCGTLVAIGQRHFSLRAGLLAAALFASLPVVLVEATTAYVDLSLCAYVLLAFMCFANWQKLNDKSWMSWCGVFCGFALGVKYSAALFVIWLGVCALAVCVLERKKQVENKDQGLAVAGFAIIALLIGGGWYLRNTIWTGNPVYPFAYEIFGGKGWTLEMAKGYSQDQAAFGFGRGVIDFFLAPWRVAMAPLNFGQPWWPVLNSSVTSGSAGRFEVPGHVLQTFIGPALLAFGPPLLFIRRKPALIGFLLWTFAAMWVFWFLTSQQLRYLLPSLALLCICCGWLLHQLATRSKFLRRVSAIALTSWLLLASAHTPWRMREVVPLVAGFDQPEYFLTRTFPAYDAMKWASTNTPQNAKFAVYGEPRCFYLRRNYLWADDAHNNLIDYAVVTTGSKLVDALRQHGATHVFLNTQAERNGGFGGPPPHMAQAIESGLLRQLYEARGYRVFEIAPGGDAR